MRKDREEKIELEKLRLEKFENDMQVRREELGEDEQFDEEAEKADWEDRNPAIEIPPEVVEEIDVDLEDETAE